MGCQVKKISSIFAAMQGVWLDWLQNGIGVEDEIELLWGAVIRFKEAGQGFSWFELNDGKQGEVQGSVGSAMPVAILLPD